MPRPLCGIAGVKCLSPGHNNTLPNSETKPRVNNLAVADLCFYPLNCTAASWDDSVKCLYQGHNSDMPNVSIKLATL